MTDIAGVYCIENEITGKQYVGISREIERRWGQHLANLRRGAHPNPLLQHDWDRLGEGAFTFKMLQELHPGDEHENAEATWIARAKEGRGAYNISTITSSNIFTDPSITESGKARRQQHIVTVWLRPDQTERLDHVADARRASRSQIVREAVEEYLTRREESVA